MEKPQFFVSHSHIDRDWVTDHVSKLRGAGFDAWYDDDIRAGTDWRNAISDKIEKSAALIYVVSPSSITSARCLEEVDFALELDLPILTVYIEETVLTNRLRFRLAKRQAIHAWRMTDDALLRKMAEALREIQEHRSRRVPHLASPSRRRLRLAVLPFQNISGETELDYLCDGLTEEVINHLGKVCRERVDIIARSSVMAFKGGSVKEIGADLEADIVVEGSVRSDDKRIRLRVGLVRTEDEVQIWGDSFEARIEGGAPSVFEIQDSIAQGVSDSLELAISQESMRSYSSAINRAKDAYLKGKFHWYRHSPEDFQIAQAYFTDAITADPSFAPAYIGLADAVATPAHQGEVPARDVFPDAKRLIDRALELDPSSPEAHDLRARIAFAYDYEWEDAKSGFEEAIRLNPSYPDAYVIEAQLLGIIGQKENALEYVRRGLNVDPHNIFFQSQLGLQLTGVGRHQDALEVYNALPDAFPVKAELLWGAYFRVGEYADAFRNARLFFAADGQVSELLGPGEIIDDARSYSAHMSNIASLLKARTNAAYVSPALIARVFTHADCLGDAADWLGRAVDIQDSYVVYAALMPEYFRLWETEAFQVFSARIGLDQYP
jgi:TolB-like protein